MADLRTMLAQILGQQEEPQPNRGPMIDPAVTAQLSRDFGGDAFGQMGRDFRAGFDRMAINARQNLPQRTVSALSGALPGWEGLAQQRSMADATQAGLQAPGQFPPTGAGVRVPQERPPASAPRWQGPNRQLGATWEPPAPYTPTEQVDPEPWRQVLDFERPVGTRPRLQVNAITGEATPLPRSRAETDGYLPPGEPGRRGAAPASAPAPSREQMELMEDSAWRSALQRARGQIASEGDDPTGLRGAAYMERLPLRGRAFADRSIASFVEGQRPPPLKTANAPRRSR